MTALLTFRQLQERVAALAGRQRAVAAFLFGVCATFCLPPFFLFPLLIPSFCGLLWLAASAPTHKRAFLDGWWWGFGHFTTGLYWMCISLLVDPWKFAWLIPFTLVGLNGVIALYPALAALALRILRVKSNVRGVAALACVWVLDEYARGHLFTGFPWNLIGYTWSGFDSVAQAASVIGVYGLSFITVLVAAMPASGSKRAMLLVWFGFAIMTGAGAWRLHEAGETKMVPGVMLRLVQPDVEQRDKSDARRQMQWIEEYIAFSRSKGADKVTHVVWPEAAIDYALNLSPSLLDMLYAAVPTHGALLTGTLHAENATPELRVWNSLAVIPPRNGAITYFDKHHLVPFGEFVPFRDIVPLDKIAPGPKDFSRGPGPATIPVPAAPLVSPLICYEAIFPGEVADQAHRPGWLLNITNDAWFGNSIGPYQHFYMAKMRAVEEGLPLVRVANTGISGVIDAYGRVLTRLPLGARGIVDSPLPTALTTPTTYGSIREKYLLLLACIGILFTLFYEYKPNFKR